MHMNDAEAVVARRIAFLERELDRMGTTAADLEDELRLNPTDGQARQHLTALYAVAGDTWNKIQELRARQGSHHAAIHFDRHADPTAERSWRQALV
jgi:hypothetical protein